MKKKYFYILPITFSMLIGEPFATATEGEVSIAAATENSDSTSILQATKHLIAVATELARGDRRYR